MIRLFLVILLSLLLFSSCSYDGLDSLFLEQFWASRSEPFVVVEFREDDHIEEAGVLGEASTGSGGKAPLVAWKESSRQIDSLITKYYIVMLDTVSMEPIWISKASRESRNTAFATDIEDYSSPDSGEFLIVVLPVSRAFSFSAVKDFKAFITEVMALSEAAGGKSKLAQKLRRLGILGMGLALCRVGASGEKSDEKAGEKAGEKADEKSDEKAGEKADEKEVEVEPVYLPLRINGIADGSAFTSDYLHEGKPFITWTGGAPADRYYIIIKDEDGKVNWLASFSGRARDSKAILEEHVEYDLNRSVRIGTKNHTISLYSVSSDFLAGDASFIERGLESLGRGVLSSFTSRVYVGFKVWTEGILGDIMDSRHIDDGRGDTDGKSRPLIKWSWTQDPGNIGRYYVWITKKGYRQPGISKPLGIWSPRTSWAYRSNPPVWLSRTPDMDSAGAYNIGTAIGGSLPGYQGLRRETTEQTYYISVFAIRKYSFGIISTDDEYIPNFLKDIREPLAPSGLPSEVLGWTSIEFKVPAVAPFVLSRPRGILSESHIGTGAEAPFVSWKSAPLGTSSYYLAMKKINKAEGGSEAGLNWLVRVGANAGLDTSEIAETLLDYVAPKKEVLEQEYDIEVYSVDDSFEVLEGVNELYSSLRAMSSGVLGKASSRVSVAAALPFYISSPASGTKLGEGHTGFGAEAPFVSWEGGPISVSSYYLVMRDSGGKLNWLLELDGRNTDSVINTLKAYEPPEKLALERSYNIDVYAVDDSFSRPLSAEDLEESLGGSGVLDRASTVVKVARDLDFYISSSSIEGRFLKSEHLSNSNPPLVEFGWKAGTKPSSLARYYISITPEDFTPSLSARPNWYAYIGSEAVSSEGAFLWKAFGKSFPYLAPGRGDKRKYSISVMAVKSDFSPLAIREVNVALVQPGGLPATLTDAGVLALDIIDFYIPD